MAVRSSRQQAVLQELTEWWEDISEARIGSRVVLVEVPPGWGATTVLREFQGTVADVDRPVAISVSVDEVLLVDRAIEATALSDALMAPLNRSRLAHLFGLNTAAGKAGLALGVGGLFVLGMSAQVSLLMAPLAATAAQNAWDASPAGQQGVLARAARAVAAISAEVPVAVILDDADRFDPGLATVMIDNLASRLDGQVLVAAAIRPGSKLAADLRAPTGTGWRAGLCGPKPIRHEPGIPDRASPRIAPRATRPRRRADRARTASFGEVFTVAGADKLTDAITADGPAVVHMVDTVINAVAGPSHALARARVLAGPVASSPNARRSGAGAYSANPVTRTTTRRSSGPAAWSGCATQPPLKCASTSVCCPPRPGVR